MNQTAPVSATYAVPPTFDRNIVFHFNKMHLQEPTIPMWTVKFKGQTHYVHHLDSKVGFSTKETPEGKTKGSLKFRGYIEIIKHNTQLIAKITKDENINQRNS